MYRRPQPKRPEDENRIDVLYAKVVAILQESKLYQFVSQPLKGETKEPHLLRARALAEYIRYKIIDACSRDIELGETIPNARQVLNMYILSTPLKTLDKEIDTAIDTARGKTGERGPRGR